jgi:hypothetical protein
MQVKLNALEQSEQKMKMHRPLIASVTNHTFFSAGIILYRMFYAVLAMVLVPSRSSKQSSHFKNGRRKQKQNVNEKYTHV